MAKTPQGVETKRILLKCSSELFYECGYCKTKMQSIADGAGITIGSIGYYFKKKEDIAGELLKNYLSKLYSYIIRNGGRSLNSFTLHTTASLPYYKNIYENEKIKRFYYELITSGSMHSDINSRSSFRKMADKINSKIAKENGVLVDDFNSTLITIFNSGARNSMIIKIMEGFFSEDRLDDAINYISIGIGSVFGMQRDGIIEAVEYCNKFNEDHKDNLEKIVALDI